MADKNQQMYPLAPVTGYHRSDEESANHELRKKKRMKCLVYIAILALIQAAIIIVFVFAVVRINTPRVRLDRITVTNSTVSGNKRLNARVTVRNTNFGRYRFESSTATLTSGGVTVGQFIIPDGRARSRSSRRHDILVDVNPGDRVNGILEVTSEANVRGRVEVLRVFRRRRTARMSCTMSINLATNGVQDLVCW